MKGTLILLLQRDSTHGTANHKILPTIGIDFIIPI